MKTYNEIDEYFKQMSVKELLQYYDECKTVIKSNDYKIVKDAVEYCFGEVNIIQLQINQLHWHFINALIDKLKKTIKEYEI